MIDWYKKVVFENYANFKGRARRSEYWYFALGNLILFIIAAVIDNVAGINFDPIPYGPIYLLVGLATFIPSLAVLVRRLHDVGKSGWFLLLNLIPVVSLYLVYLVYIKKGDVGDNQYGPDPKHED